MGKILNKIISIHMIDWDEKLFLGIHIYNTTHKSAIKMTSYFMVHSMHIIQGIELDIPTFRVMGQFEKNKEVIT